MLVRGLQSEFVTECPEAEQAAARDVTEITTVPKRLSSKRIAEMNLDKRNLNGQESISQGHARVRKAAGVQDDKIDVIGSRLLNAINEFVFCIALKANKLMPQLGRHRHTAFLDIFETRCAIDVRLSRAQQVQVWAI